jgi:DHA2 family multidrug resistance protein
MNRVVNPRMALAVTTAGQFMTMLDTNNINLALPSILDEFGASLSAGQLVVASYVMALAIVVPLSGFLGERIGMKRLYMFTLGGFVAGSALCGLAWNVQSLIAFRILQGLCGGMLQPLGMALVFTMITPMERPKYIAILGLPNLVAPILGPAVGGFIVEYASWRYIFLINFPVGIIDIFAARWLLRETEIKHETRLDVWGFTFATMAFPSLLLGFSLAPDEGWTSAHVLMLFAVGLTALALFVRTELRHRDPMLRISLFKDSMFRLAIFVQWVGIFSLFGLNFIVPLFLQRVHGFGAAEAGRILLPMGIVAFISMNAAGQLYYRLGPRPLVMFGLSVLLVTTVAWGVVDEDTPFWVLMVIVSLRGLGLGMFGQIVQVVAYNAVPKENLSRATGLVNVGQRIDTAFSTAVLTSILLLGLHLSGAPEGTSISAGTAPVDDMLLAFHYAFYFMTCMCILGLVMAFFLRDKLWEEQRRGAAVAVEEDAASDSREATRVGPAA